MRQATMSPKNATLPRTRSVVWSTTADFARQLDFNGTRPETTLTQNDVGEEHDRNAHESLAIPPFRPRVCFAHERGRSIVQGGRNREWEKRCRSNGTRKYAIPGRIRSDCSPFKGPLITVGSFPRRALRRRGSKTLLLLSGCCFGASIASAAAPVVSDDVGDRCFSPSAVGLADGPMAPARVGSSGSDPAEFRMLRFSIVAYSRDKPVPRALVSQHLQTAATAIELQPRQRVLTCSPDLFWSRNPKRSPNGVAVRPGLVRARSAVPCSLTRHLPCTLRYCLLRQTERRLARRWLLEIRSRETYACLISSRSARSIT